MRSQGQSQSGHFEQHTPDADCRIVDYTRNTSTGFCQSHQLSTRDDYYNFGSLNIADETHSR